MTIGELIERLSPTVGGELIRGEASAVVVRVGSSSAADRSTLIFAETEAEAQKAVRLNGMQAAAVVVPQDFKPGAEPGAWNGVTAVIAAKQPRLWFAKAAKLLAGSDGFGGIHPAAVIAESAVIGEGSSIGAGAIVGDRVRIGRDCRIYPRAVIYPNTELGDRVVVHAGAVLGADGFGYVRDRNTGAYTQFPQQGTLVIEDDVEIGANTTIDRGALHETRIRRGTKIDNLVHIGHNCDIGEDVVIAAQTGISGSSTVGAGAVIAGQVGVGDHAHIGPGVILGGQAGVLSGKTLTTTGTVLWGTPAKPLKEYLRELAALARLARKSRAQGT